jgi:thiosulfate/3-mercaptopyruvate sulfurtransferase
MRFPSHEVFQERLRAWGVNDDSTVVLYDDSRTALTSRLYFMLELYGFNMEQVKILDGGTLEWSAFNDLEKEPVERQPGTVTLKPANPDLLVEWTDVYDDVVSRRDSNVVLLDARPKDMYTGEVIRHSIQGGHIPGAVNVVRPGWHGRPVAEVAVGRRPCWPLLAATKG